MYRQVKINISNFIHENIKAYKIIFDDKKVINSLNNILDYKKNNKLIDYKNVLIDGGFYNLGYYYRLQLLRASIYSEGINELGFIWDCNEKICKNVLRSIGIKNIYFLKDFFHEKYLDEAEYIAKKIKSKSDLIEYDYPFGVPGAYLYDFILKGQRAATVNIYDKNLKLYIHKYLSSIRFSEYLINNFQPDLVALSHGISYQCAPLAWMSAKNNIPVVILYGEYGVPRFWKLSKPKDIFYGFGHPNKKDLKTLDKNKAIKLEKVGSKYISQRLKGNSLDISSRYAYQRGKKTFDVFNDDNDSKKKFIAIYLGNWFDFPHIFGMSRFLDVLDWIKQTIAKAKDNKNIIWLLKHHPMDKWYGGLPLKDVLPKTLPSNIYIVPSEYSGQAILQKADALITYHGTSGLEFASQGKPVMVADKGWYHDCGFVKYPKSKESYLKYLNEEWYLKKTHINVRSKANTFAGLYFGIPRWQKNCILADDADRDILRETLPEFISKNNLYLKKEIQFISKWLPTRNLDYHTFKMINSSEYSILKLKSSSKKN